MRGIACDATRWACETPERERKREREGECVRERERERKRKSIARREHNGEETKKRFAVEREYGTYKTVKALAPRKKSVNPSTLSLLGSAADLAQKCEAVPRRARM